MWIKELETTKNVCSVGVLRLTIDTYRDYKEFLLAMIIKEQSQIQIFFFVSQDGCCVQARLRTKTLHPLDGPRRTRSLYITNK